MMAMIDTYTDRHRAELERLATATVETFTYRRKRYYFVSDENTAREREYQIGKEKTTVLTACPPGTEDKPLIFAGRLGDGPEGWLTLGDLFALKGNPITTVSDDEGVWFEAGGRRLIPADDTTHFLWSIRLMRERGCFYRIDVALPRKTKWGTKVFHFYCLEEPGRTVDDLLDRLSGHDWGDAPETVSSAIAKGKVSLTLVSRLDQVDEEWRDATPYVFGRFDYLVNWVDLSNGQMGLLFEGSGVRWSEDHSTVEFVNAKTDGDNEGH